MIIHGDIDAIAAYPENAPYAFARANAPRYLLTVRDGSHTAFTELAASLFDQLDNPDVPGCTALGGPRQQPDDDEPFFPDLGGEDAGIAPGVCPQSCVGPYPRAIRPPRQRTLARLGVLPFFEAYLRGREEMRAYLTDAFAAENPDATLEYEP
jgi:hypothetical protein